MICYFKRRDAKIASVDEIAEAVQTWFKENPGFFDPHADKIPDIKKLRENKKLTDMPPLIQNCPTYDKSGNYMFNHFGWYTTMMLFSGVVDKGIKTPRLYEESYTEGFRMNIQLRRGEKLVRNWGNKNLHVNMTGGGRTSEVFNTKVLYYTPILGDLANGRIGNGTLDYTLPIGALETHGISTENISTRAACANELFICAQEADKPGVFVLRRPCSYVYLKGTLEFNTKVADAGEILVELSDNNGNKWKEIARVTTSGAQNIELQPYIIRKYDYRLKFSIKGAGTGISSLRILTDIQHSQSALPALGTGNNTITFSAGKQEGTISIEPGTDKEFQPTKDDFGVQQAGDTVTIPIETPHDMNTLRFGCNYRATSAQDGFDLQLSFDDGKKFKTFDRAKGLVKFNTKWISVTDIPAGTRKAVVRYAPDSKENLHLLATASMPIMPSPLAGLRP
jgi:hypothetical protein